MAEQLRPVMMENVQLRFLNFAGAPDTYNKAGGKRTFAVLLDPDVARAMLRDGWNVKNLKAREEGDIDQPYISVEASYKVRPPQIFLITKRGRTPISEAEIAMLDWVDIQNVDLVLNPFYWDINGSSGVKAYLGSMYMTILEDDLAAKYADIPISGQH